VDMVKCNNLPARNVEHKENGTSIRPLVRAGQRYWNLPGSILDDLIPVLIVTMQDSHGPRNLKSAEEQGLPEANQGKFRPVCI